MREYTSLALCTLVVNWTLTLLASIAVIVVYCHRLAGRGLFSSIRPDDVLLLVSLVVALVLVSLSTWAILDEGQAEHQENVSGSHLERAAKSLLVAEALWTLVTALLRIAACLLAYSSFSSSKFARRITITISALSIGVAFASCMQIFLICRPFAAQWDPRVLGSCGDQVASFMALESAGLLLDLGILTVPVVMILGLQTRLENKIRLIVVFNIGAVVLVVTGLRMAALRNAVSPDFTYSQSYLSLLSASGCMTGIICCGSPSLWAVLKKPVCGKQQRRRHPVKALQVYMSRPTLRRAKITNSLSELEEGRSDHGLEPVHQLRIKERRVEQGTKIDPAPDIRVPGYHHSVGVNKGAIALTKFDRLHDYELALREGQLVYVWERLRQGWLLVEDVLTNATGLVPERCVRMLVLGGDVSGWDTRAELNSWWRSHAFSYVDNGSAR